MRRGLLLLLALGAVACGSILGLGDYDIGGDLVDAGEASLDGGGPVTLDGGITISATTLAFPEGKCGEKKTLPLTLTNHSAVAVPLAVTAPANITVSGAMPSIPPNGTVTLAIDSMGVDAGTVTVDIAGQRFDLPITGKFAGPRLGVDTNQVDFGEIRHDLVSAPQTINLENTSDEDVTVTGIEAGKDFALVAPVLVPAHGKATASFTMTAGPGGDSITASAPLSTDKPVCDALPAIVFKGRRSPTDVTVGKSSVEVPCNNNGAALPVVVSNYGSASVTLAVKTQAPLNVNPLNASLLPGSADAPSQASFTVNFSAQTLGDYSYDLVITEGALPPRTVTVRVHLYGARLEYDTSQIDTDGGTVSRPATNVGNVPVCIHYALGGTDGTTLITLEPDEEFDPNVPGDIKVTTSTPSGAPHHQDHARLKLNAVPCAGATTAAPLCAGLSALDIYIRH